MCLPLSISKKITLTTSHQKARRGRGSSSSLLMQRNTHTPWRTTFTIQPTRDHNHFFILILVLFLAMFWSILLTKPMFWLQQWHWLGCCSWIYFRPHSFYCSCLFPIIVHLRNLFLLSTLVTRMLLTPRWVSRWKDVKQLSIDISKLKVEVNCSISRRTTFLLIPI